MEEDEEIILENSPLDSYLKEVTTEDFSKYESVVNSQHFTDVTAESLATTLENEQQQHHKSRIEVNIHNKEILLAAVQLLDSSLMNSEDSSLLIDIREDLEKALIFISSVQQQPPQKITLKDLFNEHWVAILVVFLSILAPYLLSINPTIMFVSVFLLSSLYFIHCFRNSRKPEPVAPETKIVDFVNIYLKIDQIMDKSIKHIKEVEVINTGLQIYRDKIAGNQMLLGGRTPKCLNLRNVMLDMLIDLFLEMRVNLRNLLKCHSDELFSFKEEYIASIPLDRFDDIVSHEKPPSDNLTLPAVSLKKLKSLVYLYRALLSEFVLGLIVCFYSNISHSKGNDVGDLYHVLDQLLTVSKNYPELLEKTLEKSLKLTFIKDMGTAQRNKTIVKKSSESVSEQYFNNCKINLFSALKRIEEAEEVINKKDSSTSEPIDLFEKIVLEFFMNVDNARACVEDVLELHRPKPQKSFGDDQNHKELEEDDCNTFDKIPTSAILEREMGDRMYEGESLNVPAGIDEPVDIEDLQQQLKEKRESKRLLKELKTVFKVKESPAGLLSFPLAKADDGNDIEEETLSEDEREEEEEELIIRQAKRKNKYMLQRDEDFCGTGEENDERLQFMAATPIGLSVNLLQQGLSSMLKNRTGCTEEETFGSSDDDDDG